MSYNVKEIQSSIKMQSIIILGKDKDQIRLAAKDICDENKISRFDKEVIETEKAVGIGDIRKLQEKLFLKPLQSEMKAVVLEAFFGMTADSQNAFLKVLEEPPANTIILILSLALDFFLPTVMSRCNLINLDTTKKISEQEIADNLQLISEIKNGTTSKALKVAGDYGKDREVALEFLEGLIISLHTNLERDNLQTFKALQKTYTIIKTTNVAPRLALENLFLNF
jgi:DNA polymerase III gamma/tau subunit